MLLIKLPIELKETPFVAINADPNIPNAYAEGKERILTVLGWGVTEYGDSSTASEILQKANLHYVKNYVCGIAYGYEHIKPNMLCAHSYQGRDACTGDSGGPLVIQYGHGPQNDLLVGIVSWGSSCGSTYP